VLEMNPCLEQNCGCYDPDGGCTMSSLDRFYACPLESSSNVYRRNGHESREDYLNSLADEYDCPIETVLTLADVLGRGEDFDGLVSSLKDYEEMRD